MNEIVMIDGKGEDPGETHGGDARAPGQLTRQTMPNAQLPKPPIKTQATVESDTSKGNHARDSLSKKASMAKNAIQLIQCITFKDLTSTT